MLSRALERTGFFYVLSDIHRPPGGMSASSQKIDDETDIEVSRRDAECLINFNSVFLP